MNRATTKWAKKENLEIHTWKNYSQPYSSVLTKSWKCTYNLIMDGMKVNWIALDSCGVKFVTFNATKLGSFVMVVWSYANVSVSNLSSSSLLVMKNWPTESPFHNDSAIRFTNWEVKSGSLIFYQMPISTI